MKELNSLSSTVALMNSLSSEIRACLMNQCSLNCPSSLDSSRAETGDEILLEEKENHHDRH